jgi:hypothetical protein
VSNKIRNILSAAADDPNVLQQLIRDPKAIAKEFKLNRAEAARLLHSDVLVSVAKNPLLDIAGKTETIPITVTVTRHHQMDSGDPEPFTLEELSHERLVEVTQRILAEPDYAARVRAFLKSR